MIPTKTERQTLANGGMARAAFSISSANSSHIMGILREGLYSDRPLAVLREYSANAWDAHRSVGKGDVPIEVDLPTAESLVLKIRDRGPGLSREQMFELYTTYGDSTKRDGNDQVGMLGIGSKSAFCYTTSFTITSWHGGTRAVYVADLGEDDVGGISLVHEAPCDPEETGLEIQLAVQSVDRWEFCDTARKLFQHFEPRPVITMGGVPDLFTLPDVPDERTVLASGTIYPESGEWIAVMGCVPYRIDMDKLDAREVNPALAHMSGRLVFDIGEVQVSSSRENLKYNAQTKRALVDKANALVDEFVLHALSELESGNVTGWAARLQVRVLQQLELPLPEEWRPLAEAYAKITYDPTVFTIVHNKAGCTRVVVEEGTRLLLCDTDLDVAGYDLDADDYVVRSVPDPLGNKLSTDELRAALDGVLAEAGLTGVRVELLSTVRWSTPHAGHGSKRPKVGKNPKHRAKMFQLSGEPRLPRRKSPKSDNWEAVTRSPQHDDVFVIVESFCAKDDDAFWADVNSDRALCESLGVTFPPIYGYKTTEKRPVLASQCIGTSYREWRGPFFQALMTDERRATLEQCWQADLDVASPDEDDLTWLAGQLGEDHPVVAMYRSEVAAQEALDAAGVDRGALVNLGHRCGLVREGSWHDEHVKKVLAPYKLLNRAGIRELWRTGWGVEDEERDEWVEYVKMVDTTHAPAGTRAGHVVQLRSVP